MNSIISVKNLSFKYSNTERNVFQNLSFNILESKINLLLGSSGCGKSTIIKCLTGLIPNSIEGKIDGQVLYKSENIIGKMPHELCHEIGIVFQDPESQFCTFTVEDEIAFGLENIRLSKEKMDNRISKVLDLVKITHLRGKVLNELSGGEKQKVAIAAVLALNPKCIIFDEPTANLDPKSTLEIFELLVNLKEKENKTILIIEHKVDDIIEFVDNVILINDKSDVVEGTTKEVIDEVCDKCDELPMWVPETTVISKELKLRGVSNYYFYRREDAIKCLRTISDKVNNSNDVKCVHNGVNKKEKLKIENLTFSYNKNKEILKDTNIEIKEGDFIALLGRNGAGKSTLSKILLGLYKNYKGKVFIDNKNLKDFKRQDLNNKIGIAFQNPEHQFVANTVYDELAYSLRVNKIDEKFIGEKVKSVLEKFNLYQFKDFNPYLLSQGQKRRLSVASMLITGQEILILDEPTFGQDKENTIELMEYMKDINKTGITIVIITHDMNLVASYCDKAILLNDGKVVYDGDIKQLFLNEKLLNNSNLKSPIIKSISMEVLKLNEKFPVFFNIKSFMEALQEVKCYDCI